MDRGGNSYLKKGEGAGPSHSPGIGGGQYERGVFKGAGDTLLGSGGGKRKRGKHI